MLLYLLIVLYLSSCAFDVQSHIYVSGLYLVFFANLLLGMHFIFSSQLGLFPRSLFFLCTLVSWVVVICMSKQLQTVRWQGIVLFSFTITTYYFVYTSSIGVMFLCYEALMLPSVLLLYTGTYTRRIFPAMVYFFIWTQGGSLVAFAPVVYINSILGGVDIFAAGRVLTAVLDPESIKVLSFITFLGFAVKIPVFPFYRWLVQVHVEAQSGFSIFLSGFLVKAALFFYYKIGFILPYSYDYVIFSLIMFSIINSSFRIWFQSDLKKVVAYATIQEMNMILLIMIHAEHRLMHLVALFCIGHALLSALMFYIVDLVYKRYHTRNITEIFSVCILAPRLHKVIFCHLLIFFGIPGSTKFTLEFMFYLFCFTLNTYLGIFLFAVINVVGVLGYAKVWLPILFSPLQRKETIHDLSLQEVSLCTLLLLLNCVVNFTLLL